MSYIKRLCGVVLTSLALSPLSLALATTFTIPTLFYKNCPVPPVTCTDRTIQVEEPYNAIVVDGWLEAIPTRAPFSRGITVTGQCKHLQDVHTKVINGTLLVQTRSYYSSAEQLAPLKVFIPINGLKTLTVTLKGNSEMIMPKLGLTTLNIRTRDEAHAQVTASTWLNAIALDHSSIYFTGHPTHVVMLSNDKSLVIPLRSTNYY